MAISNKTALALGAMNTATSGGTSAGGSVNSSNSYSKTYGSEATSAARANAQSANDYAMQAWRESAEFNRQEAQKQRDWQEKMANTVYQRTVNDMIASGINPVLAAGMGLGTAGVSGGAAASVGNPMSFMSGTYADSESASKAEGSSWQESMSGLAYLADAIKNMYDNMTSSINISVALDGLKQVVEDKAYDKQKDYEGAKETGAPNKESGYTDHYDSDTKKYLKEEEVKTESFLEGVYRGIRNKLNAYLQ